MRWLLVVREVPQMTPDYSLVFDTPELPRVGDCLSVRRPDKLYGHTEDVIVRNIWWRLDHPETGSVSSEEPKVGSIADIQVECDPALGPHSSDSWRAIYEPYLGQGQVEEFNIRRYSIAEKEFEKP